MKTWTALVPALAISGLVLIGCTKARVEPDVATIRVPLAAELHAAEYRAQVAELVRRGYRAESTLPADGESVVILRGADTTRRHPAAGATIRRLQDEFVAAVVQNRGVKYSGHSDCPFCAVLIDRPTSDSLMSWPPKYCECDGAGIHLVAAR